MRKCHVNYRSAVRFYVAPLDLFPASFLSASPLQRYRSTVPWARSLICDVHLLGGMYRMMCGVCLVESVKF